MWVRGSVRKTEIVVKFEDFRLQRPLKLFIVRVTEWSKRHTDGTVMNVHSSVMKTRLLSFTCLQSSKPHNDWIVRSANFFFHRVPLWTRWVRRNQAIFGMENVE